MERTECIMMNIPLAFFKENAIGTGFFARWYQMESAANDQWVFNHFISTVPRQNVIYCYILFAGAVRMRVNIVEFLKNKTLALPNDQGGLTTYGPRNWMVATGPVALPPERIPMKGFRGFRYCEKLF